MLLKIELMVVVSVYEQLLFNTKNKLLESDRSNAGLKDKLFEIFDFNNAEFEKLASIYGGDKTMIFERLEYEHQQLENFKKSMYGDNYTVKPFAY